MAMKFYDVKLVQGNDSRFVRVPSPTDVEAADAAVQLAKPGEERGAITEVQDDGLQHADGKPPVGQAEELASVTPGMAAVPAGQG